MILPIWILLFSLLSPKPDLADKGSLAPTMLECESDNTTFKAGEQLTYKLYYNWNFVWLSAGEVVFKVSDLGDRYKISANGRTYSSYEWFFKADDYFESIVDKSTLLPLSFKRDIKENKYRYFEKVEFDQQGNRLRSWTGKSEESATLANHSLNGCVHDILAMVYSIRTQDFDALKKNSVVPVNIFLDNKEYNLNLAYLGLEEDKKVYKLGRYKTHHLSPEVIAGTVFKEKDRMHIWASADQNRIPLLIESPVSVGSIKAVLKDYKGLKYKFEEN